MNDRIITPIRLNVKVSNRSQNAGAKATIDSACEGVIVNETWVKRHRFPTYTLNNPIRVRNVDDTINKAGLIRSALDVNLTIRDISGRTHTERVQMFISNLGKDDLILGTDWLKYHDPSIEWRRREVHFDRCPQKCQQPHGFTRAREEPPYSRRLSNVEPRHKPRINEREKQRLEHLRRLSEDVGLRDHSGTFGVRLRAYLKRKWLLKDIRKYAEEKRKAQDKPSLSPNEGEPDLPDKPSGKQATRDPVIRKLAPEPSGFASFDQDLEDEIIVTNLKERVPKAHHEFLDIFSERKSQRLPEHTYWDHAIDLKPTFKPQVPKIYALSPEKHDKLGKFIKEHPIHLANSSPIFLYREKGWKTTPGTGLSPLKFAHHPECVPPSTNPGTTGCDKRGHHF
ncbi:hypothetical protein HETIRDRAFT_317583 [Heterobasidion irregulare TC 32-1]|uniref:Uncharacterized protein n=4 Tax=Heterobasidion irregulare (strain TC 32-1) TaxID=747525 RepID=W4K6P8_HETIT|nr:uncharacterized protein HETIRDRAFT_317583 [Heterobasidion irregulare TC 32-1]ETW81478.1 hypothetical protein HETIRDRAFT_317583 [Heterobasidion irregulare TC 32-1]